MKAANKLNDGRNNGLQQQRFQREEFRACVRALLMTPLMSPADDDFAAVRRQTEALREWFSRETGWILQVEREGARLYKRPGNLTDAMRGLPGYDRRRYVLLCLACAVLERADPQITLRLLGERLLELAAEPALDFTFTLEAQHERRDLAGEQHDGDQPEQVTHAVGSDNVGLQPGNLGSRQRELADCLGRRADHGRFRCSTGEQTSRSAAIELKECDGPEHEPNDYHQLDN